MALSGMAPKRIGELRIHETLDELKTDLADYIAELSEATVKERGVFSVALSGGPLIDLMGYILNLPSPHHAYFLFFMILVLRMSRVAIMGHSQD